MGHITDFKHPKSIRMHVYLYLSTVDDEDDDFTLDMIVQLIHNWAQNDSQHSNYDLNSLNQSKENIRIANKLQSLCVLVYSQYIEIHSILD